MYAQVYKPATAENHRAEVLFLRHYSRGVLKRETVLRVAENDLRAHELKKSAKMRKAEKVAAAQVRLGEGCLSEQSTGLAKQTMRVLCGSLQVWRGVSSCFSASACTHAMPRPSSLYLLHACALPDV